MEIDHVVLWVDDQKRALAFYTDIVGLTPVRAQEFEAGRVGFPSVRVNDRTILDLMLRQNLAAVQRFTAGGDGGGAPINHVCLAVAAEEYAALRARLEQGGVVLTSGGERAFGARGAATRSEYFSDPDRNVIEIRSYA